MDFNKIKNAFRREPKLIEIKERKKIVFVGDTHGDIETSQLIIKKYLKPGNLVVFLGDYVDRGRFSKENLDFLLETKIHYPRQLYLLQGNHEAHHILKFFPADFWQELNEKEYKEYSSITDKLPLVLVAKDIIALHGVLPDVESLDKINNIKMGDPEWKQITWGDFVEKKGKDLGLSVLSGRPQFGEDYFREIMTRFKKRVLVRAHQANCPPFMFNKRCVTLFTSSSYLRQRTIAIADLKKKIKTGRDIQTLNF